MFIGAGLFLFPITEATYDFRTDVREDTAEVETAVAVTTGNMTLIKAVYDSDTSTIDLASSLPSDLPVYSSYNVTSRQLVFAGLTANESRTMYVNYDVDALVGTPSIGTLLNINPFLWYAFAIVFIGASIAALVLGRA